MSIRKLKNITREERVFLVPKNSTHRQYEALRAFFIDKLPSKDAALQFGYTPGSFRIMCHAFRQDLDREFFIPPTKGPQATPKRDVVREMVVSLRKRNLSVYDIERVLKEGGHRLSRSATATKSRSRVTFFGTSSRRRPTSLCQMMTCL